ncbi:hypothetical protein [Halosolutus gelatinilyticus]|uniref:hypothetical protein n=1 Tax=Halosolutus gelatinilyticus TaxID=2931975 RepID=UPI001FF3FFAB|nr:hypothetical protein [Halosolutus gelatinilyticus]
MQNQRLLESSWDYCVVLDACRYDVFDGVYDDYLDGKLEKRWSTGSSTPEWASRTFTGTHDITYFSGNPFINDLGIPLNELKWGASCDYEWTANEHLTDVIDVWNRGWCDELGTVPPGSLARSVRVHRDLVARTDRTVIHYMQPHAPYLARGSGRKLRQIQKGILSQSEADAAGGPISSLAETIRPALESTLEGIELAQKMGLWLELDPLDILQNGTREVVMDRYEDNLRIVLDAVADLLPELDGTIVVTADHGEAFGENGVWEHHVETPIPPLMEVPWLEVE